MVGFASHTAFMVAVVANEPRDMASSGALLLPLCLKAQEPSSKSA